MHARERRRDERGRFHLTKDLLYGALRAIARHASGFYTAFGIFLIAGVLLAIAGTWLFAELAEHVQGGATQRFDDTVLQWMAEHRVQWIERSLVEITALGSGLVVMVMMGVVALFLVHTRHKWSAFLLLFATAGGLLLSAILKSAFDRPRPAIFTWATHVASSSFPSGHAMTATIVYGTIGFLLARLQRSRATRVLTIVGALAFIVLISASRMYLGVHYPSDVMGGAIIGLAWAGFCVAGLEAVLVFAKRFREPKQIAAEEDLDTRQRDAAR